jgi:hypothetical protein
MIQRTDHVRQEGVVQVMTRSPHMPVLIGERI